jgi:SAM-dependent methyltransferase
VVAAMDPAHIPLHRIYADLAHLMPLISPPEEYAAEAAHWRAVLREKLGPDRPAVLELGAGGGHNLSHLTTDVDATAVDLSEPMLAECRRLNPGVATIAGDMRTVRLGRIFDAVLIHDAISYMLNAADLAAAFATAAAHLRPQGILITSPDRYREHFRPPAVAQATHASGDRQITYFEYTHDPDPHDTTVETIMVYFIRSADGLRIEHDRHLTGVFARTTWLQLLAAAGFTVESRVYDLPDWPRPYELLVGTRR